MDTTLKRFLKVSAIVFLLLTSAKTFAAATNTPETYNNLGFLQNGIWYSKDPFFDGDAVRIYSAVFNSSEYDLVGKIEFYDNGKLLGQTDFSVTSGGKIRDVWVDFTATNGAHNFSAKIIEAWLSKIGAQTEIVVLSNYQTGTDTRIVDIDTDKDGIGNAKDLDDDGDGILDTTEVKNGTDPLIKETVKENEGPKPTGGDAAIDLLKNPPEGAASKSAEIAKKMFEFAFDTTKTTLGKINDFVSTQSQAIEIKKIELKKEIENAKKQPPADQLMDKIPEPAKANENFILDSPLKTAYLFILTALGFVLSNKTLFYIISIFAIYKILSLLVGFISRKIAEPKQK